jgi:hypothetical protein
MMIQWKLVYYQVLRLIIANWAIRHDITHCALNDLLKSLLKLPAFSELPKDARTLLKTPTTTIVKNMGGGIYHHFGIKEEIEELVEINQNIPSVLEKVSLQIQMSF